MHSSASPHQAPQHDSEYFFVNLEVYLKTLFSKTFHFIDFFRGWDETDRTGREGTDRNMDRQTFLGKYYFRFLLNSVFSPTTFFSDPVLRGNCYLHHDNTLFKRDFFLTTFWKIPFPLLVPLAWCSTKYT